MATSSVSTIEQTSTCKVVRWIGSHKAMAGTSRSEKATDLVHDESVMWIVGLYPNDWCLVEVTIKSVGITGISTHTG